MFEHEEIMAIIADLEEQLKVSEMAPPSAEQLIACLEGEIAKRDEELAACRIAVENCEVFRARIAELESDRDSHQRYVMLTNLLARIHRDGGQYVKQHGMDKAFADADAIVAELYAAPVSEAKAQDVVLQELLSFEKWWCSTPILRESKRTIAEKAWRAARIAAAPAAPAADAGLEVVGWYRMDDRKAITPYPSVCATWHKMGVKVGAAYSDSAQAIIGGLRGENEALHAQVKVLQSDANSWQSGYDEGRRMGGKHCALTIDQQDHRIGELERALLEVAASLAWNAHGECRAIHDGPIMPSKMAIDVAKAALSAGKDSAS